MEESDAYRLAVRTLDNRTGSGADGLCGVHDVLGRGGFDTVDNDQTVCVGEAVQSGAFGHEYEARRLRTALARREAAHHNSKGLRGCMCREGLARTRMSERLPQLERGSRSPPRG